MLFQLLLFLDSNILKHIVEDGGIFLAKHSGFLWAVLCCQLEQGHFPIKQVSIMLNYKLVIHLHTCIRSVCESTAMAICVS